MKIAIRADGGIKIGMGHIMRTLVLAKELSKRNQVFYICKVERKEGEELCIKEGFNDVNSIKQLEEFGIVDSKYIQGIEKILCEGFKVKLLNEDRLIDELKYIKADLLITDSYSVNEEYFKETRKIFDKTAYIDDLNQHSFDLDFLINQNSYAEEFHYKVNCDTKLFLGTDYILLREEFKNLQNKHIKDKVRDIMITVGGADPYKVTEKILNYISNTEYYFHVVIGPSFADTSFAENFKSHNIKFYYNADMCEIMKKCDMAISACGSTLYELSSCGVPILGIVIADNQQRSAIKLSNMKVIINLGWYNKISREDLIDSIHKLDGDYSLRKSLSEKASKLVDGRGAERIVKALCGNA